MADILHYVSSLLLCIIIPLVLFPLKKVFPEKLSTTSISNKLPKSYPIFGSYFTYLKNKGRFHQWISDIVTSTPNLTFTLCGPLGNGSIITANPANVQHILKSRFDNYLKDHSFKTAMHDLLGDGIFNTDGNNWKFQRQLASHEFNTKSLRKFVETVVESELSDRLIPILQNAARSNTILDLQDIMQRFAFDNICRIAFGYDPAYLSPSLPHQNLAAAFDEAVILSSKRLGSFTPYFKL